MIERDREFQLVEAALKGDAVTVQFLLGIMARHELVDLHDVLGNVRTLLKAAWRTGASAGRNSP